ncbi:cytochrome oxidase putative small subunit CydP [Rhodanobacter lindaniclasticus]
MSLSPAESLREAVSARPLRRLSVELFALVLVKVALLALLWWLVFAPQPRPDASPAAIERLLAPAATPAPPAQGTRP